MRISFPFFAPTRRLGLVKFVGPDDAKTCGLCRYLLGTVLPTNSVEYRRYRTPLHLRCRHRWVRLDRPSSAGADTGQLPLPLIEDLLVDGGLRPQRLSAADAASVERMLGEALTELVFDAGTPEWEREAARELLTELAEASGNDALLGLLFADVDDRPLPERRRRREDTYR